jgi:hypothetical protein
MYSSIVEMVHSQTLTARVAAAAAEEGATEPDTWARANMWAIVAAGNWDEQWDSAKAAWSPNVNPDTGARNDVITDAMILSVIQPMLGVE